MAALQRVSPLLQLRESVRLMLLLANLSSDFVGVLRLPVARGNFTDVAATSGLRRIGF